MPQNHELETITIDPNNPTAEQLPYLQELLIQNKDKAKIPIKHSYLVNGKNIQITSSLNRFGNTFWVRKGLLGKTSTKKSVKSMEVYYEPSNNGEGFSMNQRPHTESYAIKVQSFEQYKEASGRKRTPWEEYKAIVQHEVEMLTRVDPKTEMTIDEDKQQIYIKTTKVPGVELNQYLAKHPNLSFDERLQIIEKINQAVLDLYEKNKIAHLDLKPTNIFYDEKTKQIHLLDFASSADIDKLNFHDDNLGIHETTAIMSPPQFLNNTPKQVDAFSLAGVYAMVLSDWHGRDESNWPSLPVVAHKRTGTTNLKFIKYNFDNTLIAVGPENAGVMDDMVKELSKLGDLNKDERGDLESFQQKIKSIREAVTDQKKQDLTGQKIENVSKYTKQNIVEQKINANLKTLAETSIKDLNRIECLALMKIAGNLIRSREFSASSNSSIADLKKFYKDLQLPYNQTLTQDRSFIALLTNIINEAVDNRKRSKQITGSNVLQAILQHVPDEIVKSLPSDTQNNLKLYSKNYLARKLNFFHKEKILQPAANTPIITSDKKRKLS